MLVFRAAFQASCSFQVARFNLLISESLMAVTRNLGTRIELISMDPHFHDITLALYRQDQTGRPAYLVHSYSGVPGTAERLQSLRGAMATLGQLAQDGNLLHFACGSAHQAAARRTFIESAKLPPGSPAAPRSLTVLDKKSGRNITARSLGEGRYQITADGPEDGKEARIDAVVGGMVKLAELATVEGGPGQVAFPCGNAHDALIGLLLPRALNVRAILREEESAGGRGLLVAPSQQK
jgi:hypothetical protein